MNAIINAAHAIVAGDGSARGRWRGIHDAGAVRDGQPSAAFPRGEQTLYDTTLGWRFTNPRLADAYYPYSMGETAENVVERCGVSREDQDAFALESHRRWAAAHEAGRFADEVVPITAPSGRKGEEAEVTRDEHPRPDTTPEQLAALKPAFKRDAPDHGGQLVGHQRLARGGAGDVRGAGSELGLRPIMRMISSAVVGVDPATMGWDRIPRRAGAGTRRLAWTTRPHRLNECLRRRAIPVM
jgi:acetyl-CoA acetyltransferase